MLPDLRVGFTGTQNGMSAAQKKSVKRILLILSSRGYNILHHGDCVGADAEAHKIAVECNYNITIHPPVNSRLRAFCYRNVKPLTYGGMFTVLEPRPYLERNHDIVDVSNVLIAAPRTNDEELRSGTWATIRYARKIFKEQGNIFVLDVNKAFME